jgi:glycerophosphoryl diester phosphodiesterase
MKKVLLTLFGLAAVACGKTSSQPEVIAHRGFWNAAVQVPHNSIAALENSIELGCWGSEFDIWVTTDGVPVIFHDYHTKEGVLLQEVSYSELMERDGLLANGDKIPTLDEFLAVWAKSDRKVKLIFEIKSHNNTREYDSMAAEKIHQVAKAHGIKSSQMEYIAFSRYVCEALSAMNTGVPVAYLNGDLTPADAREELGITGIDYHFKVLKEHPEWISEAHDLGMTVNVWTVNEEEDIRHFTDCGVDYITTDRPDVLKTMLSGK